MSPGSGETAVLQSSRATALVDPVGSRLASLVVDGHELLAPDTGAPLLWGCYPMVPWAGRLADGRFEWDGHVVSIPADHGEHAIHGLGVFAVWTPIPAQPAPDPVETATFELDLTPRWSLGGTARTRFRLADGHLELELSVTAAAQSLPAVLGWHPCFRRRVDDVETSLSLAATRCWQRDERHIPTGRLVAVPPGPWDDCFGGVVDPPTLQWPGVLALTLRADTDVWVIYDEPDDTVCVEPQTGPPNGFNLPEPRRVEPGQTFTLSFEMTWA